MIITPQDRKNYQDLCAKTTEVETILHKLRNGVEKEKIAVIIKAASKGLVGLKDALYFSDHEPKLSTDQFLNLKLTHMGWSEKNRWYKKGAWRGMSDASLLDTILEKGFRDTIKPLTTKRSPDRFEELKVILDDAAEAVNAIRVSKYQHQVSVNLMVPMELPAYLSNTKYDTQKPRPVIDQISLLVESDWRVCVTMNCYQQKVCVHYVDNIDSQDNFLVYSEQGFITPIFHLIKEVKDAATKELTTRLRPQEHFIQKYGHFLVVKEL